MNRINHHFDGEVTLDGIHVVDRYTESEVWLHLKFDRYGVTPEIAIAYLQSLCDHVMNVRIAGQSLDVEVLQLKIHDYSKFSIAEFPHYARNFFGGKGDIDGFTRAWLHHVHHNEHHWQHWIFPDGYAPAGSSVENGIVKMDNRWLLEMVADWMGSSRTYTGSWDMTDWLGKNLPKIKLHSESWAALKSVLRNSKYGYHNILNELQVNGLIP